MRDQLDDVPGRVVEVDGSRVPRLGVEDVAEQVDPFACPREPRLETVAGDEQREVVEGAAVVGAEAHARLADGDHLAVERQAEGVAVEAGELRRPGEGHLGEPHPRNCSTDRAIPAASSPCAARCSAPVP